MIPRGPFLAILFHEHCSSCTRGPQGAQSWKSRGKEACSCHCRRALLSLAALLSCPVHRCCLYTLTGTGSPLPRAPGPKGWQQKLLERLVVSTTTLRVAQLASPGRKGCLVGGAASFQEHLANIMVLLGCKCNCFKDGTRETKKSEVGREMKRTKRTIFSFQHLLDLWHSL